MGVDFVSVRAKSFKKGWDREAAALACPDLFRQQPASEARQVEGDVQPGMQAGVGDTLTVRLTDAGMVAYRLDGIVAVFHSPPDEVLLALREGCCVATAKVEQVGIFSNTIRVSLK